MAGLTPLQGDRAAWCRERLDFFCAVINNVDRENLKVELEACETEEEASGLMHSLLWLQDNMLTHHPGGAAALQPSAPDYHMPDDNAFPGYFVAIDDPPGRQPHQHEEGHLGLPMAAAQPQELRHEPEYLGDRNHQRHHEQQQQQHDYEEYEFPFVAEGEHQTIQDAMHPDDHNLLQLQQERQQMQQQRQDYEDHEFFPPVAEDGLQTLRDTVYPDDHNPQPQQEQCYEDQEVLPSVAEGEPQMLRDAVCPDYHNPQPQQERQQQQQQQLTCKEIQDQLPRTTGTPEPDMVHGPTSDVDPHEQRILEARFEVRLADDPSNLEDHDHFEDVTEALEWGGEPEPLPPGQQCEDIPVAAAGGDEDTEPIELNSERSDPYFDAEEPSGEDFVDMEEEPLEDDPVMAPAAQANEPSSEDLDVDGAAGGGREEDDTRDDERLAKELSEAINAEERERMESDERLARELAEEMELEELRMEEEDEELARRLDGEMEDEETELNIHPQRRDNNPPVDIIFAEGEDKEEEMEERHLPPRAPQEIEEKTLGGDEETARQLQAETMLQLREEEDEKAGRVAALINMFPDADPIYLAERMEQVETEQAFRQQVEALLQCQRTEPRMSGYQKLIKQSNAASYDDDQEVAAVAASVRATTSAAAAANMQVCECTICFEEEVPVKDMGFCNAYYNYHEFCIECIRRHVAALIGQGHSQFRCMNGFCEAEFSWRTLRRVMEPVVYRKVQERRQQEEVMAAGVENLVSCPFCCFMIIMPDPEDKVLECLNPECLKESCRICKEPSHIPLRCEEVERETQKDARTMLENRMAEAMIRQCPRCGKRFVTEGGCNKMTCSCGTIMCYLCKKVITEGYNHFEHRGGVASNKCPLWSNATEVHSGEVREAAEQGRQELDPGMTLVHDPTRDLA